MNERLRDLMDELAGEQPAVADWPGRVRTAVVQRRRRQRALVAAVAAAALAVGGTGVLLAAEPPARDALVAAPDVSPSPSPAASAEATAPAPAPEPSASVETPAPSPSAEPEPTDQAAPPPPPPPASPAPTYPPSGTQVVEITAQGQPDRPKVGQEWVLDVTVTGSADEPFLQEPCYQGEPCMRVASSCVPREANYSPPPPKPSTVRRTYRHTFTTPGRHEVTLEASSRCSYYQGYDTLVLVVQVDEDPSAPSPQPSPTPA